MRFYLCEICGNVIELLYGEPIHIKCCDQHMTLLEPNTVDASVEKHVPFYKVDGNKVTVQIGEDLHPMDNDHYIMWIAIVKNNKITRINLKPHEKPIVTFNYEKGSTVYSYCNKHRLWKTEI